MENSLVLVPDDAVNTKASKLSTSKISQEVLRVMLYFAAMIQLLISGQDACHKSEMATGTCRLELQTYSYSHNYVLFTFPVTVCLIQVTTQLYHDQSIAQFEIKLIAAQTYYLDINL